MTDTEDKNVYASGCILATAGISLFIVGLIGLDPLGYFRLTYSETYRLRAESDPRLFGSGMTVAFIGLSIAAAGASRRRFREVFIVGAALAKVSLPHCLRPTVTAALIVYVIVSGHEFHRWYR